MRTEARTRRLVVLLSLAHPWLAAAGYAETVAPASDADNLEEIVVTAERRSENLERTPVAVAVISSQQLSRENITTETDLPKVTPGLIVRTGATGNEINYSLRGQSLDQYSGTTPGVLPYFNEVQISTNSGGGSGATAFYDLESVQVLKGPQGTLFGRDATGGAVLFTTAKPTNEFGGYTSVLGGDYRTLQTEAAVNLPLIPDTVLARLSGFYGRQEGYQRNLYDASDLGTGHRLGVRSSVTFKADSIVTDELVFDYYHINQLSVTSVLYNLQNIPGATPVQGYYSPASGPLFAAYLATHTNPTVDPNGVPSFLASQSARGPFAAAVNDGTLFYGTNKIGTNNLVLNFAPDIQLRNIFGYASLDSFTQGDSDGTPFGIAGDSGRINPSFEPPYGSEADTTIYSDETQLSGTTLQDALKYTTGFYYSHVKAYTRVTSSFFDLFGGIPNLNEGEKKNTTYGVYAQSTYDLGELTHVNGLSVTLGARYNDEKAEFDTLPGSQYYGLEALNPAGEYSNDQSRTFRNVAWTAGVQEQVTPDMLLYVASRRSYKDGGFNSSLAPLNGDSFAGGNGYETESITDVEFGAKFQGRLMALPTRVNLAVYNNWVRNSQRAAFALSNGSPAAITVNVPKQEDLGFEADGQVRPNSWLNVGGAFNYIDARFTDQTVGVFGAFQSFATVPDTPRFSGTVFTEATAPVTGQLSVTGRVEGYAQAFTYFASSANINAGARLPGYGVLNLLASLDDEKDGWSLIANVKNLCNKTYYIGGIPLAQLLDYNTALPGAPRTFSLQVRYRF